MAFQASKKRERRAPDPVAKGKPLGPSAAIRQWYDKNLQAVTAAMVADYRQEVLEALGHHEVEHFFSASEDAMVTFTDSLPTLYVNELELFMYGVVASVQFSIHPTVVARLSKRIAARMDAADSVFRRIMYRLNKKWSEVFNGFSAKYVPEFVEKVDDYSKSSTWFSLSAAGVKEPRLTYNKNVAATLGASQDWNHTLVTNVQKEVHEKIYSAVMASLTSPNPEEQGASGIQNALREIGKFSKKRVDLITRDQTSKLNSSLSDERMRQNGVEHFEWMHSSAGKVPRQTHVDNDGKIFALDDPRLWEGPKADQGPPGWAINCRCRKKPIIGYREDEN